MSYAMLLEEYSKEQEIDNASFSSIAEGMNSLIDFVCEDVKADLSVALESLGDQEALREASLAAAKEAAVKLAKKVKEWIPEILKKVRQIVQKAAIAAMNKGNAAMKKLIKEGKKLKKDVRMTTPALDAAQIKKVAEALGKASMKNSNDEKMVAAVDAAIANAKKLETKSKDQADVAKAGMGADEAYAKFAKPYIEDINFKKIENDVKSATDILKSEVSKLEKGSEELASKKAAIFTMMKASTALTNFAFQVLSVGVANSAKIALAAGAEKKAEEKAEEKKEEK